MALISILSDEVINQIAAGEVVERPSSVVKELVENAIDAGAKEIRVDSEAGGKSLIRVCDDGHGMTADEMELALTRHATSKLSVLADLDSLGTLGFRGEALPSIASVSKMTIASRKRGAAAGVKFSMRAGTILKREPVGMPVGTQIEVRDLLDNVPARRKFLKAETTESAQITDVMQKIALAHPEVDFSLKHKTRVALRAPAHKNGLDRVAAVLGHRLGKRLYPVEGNELGVEVTAYLAAPDMAQTTSRGLVMFVGRRAVKDRGLLHAVTRGYGELVPRGRYPAAVVKVEVPGPEVDVNVHPQKSEVRFSDAQRVYRAVRRVVARGVSEAPWLSDTVSGQPAALTVTPEPSSMARKVADAQTRALSFSFGRPKTAAYKTVSFPVEAPPSAPPSTPSAPTAPTAPAPRTSQGVHRAPEVPVTSQGFFTSLRYIGQLDRAFLVCERAGELVLVDQHAAHERVVFERLKARRGERAASSQPLLFPETIEVDEAEAATAESFSEDLAASGYVVESFGATAGRVTLAIKATPSGLRDEPEKVLRQLLRELADVSGSRAVEERLDLVLATIACHSSVRAGDTLSDAEVEALFQDLDRAPYRGNCPHGRPTVMRMSMGEIARRFGR